MQWSFVGNHKLWENHEQQQRNITLTIYPAVLESLLKRMNLSEFLNSASVNCWIQMDWVHWWMPMKWWLEWPVVRKLIVTVNFTPSQPLAKQLEPRIIPPKWEVPWIAINFLEYGCVLVHSPNCSLTCQTLIAIVHNITIFTVYRNK